MGVEFRPASIEGCAVFVAVAGSSRSGKTFTALRIARGIAGPSGRIAAIDTEAKRMSHYKADFLDAQGRPFDVYDMGPPFRPDRFLEAARRAQDGGYAALVIDSFSLEWMGEGGVLDWHEEEVEAAVKRAMARQNERRSEWAIREAAKMAAWIKPKASHKGMMTGFLQLRMPVIFCLRAEEKTKPGADGKPVNVGWVPLQDKRFLYEWTVSITLHPDTPGRMRYDLPHKVEGQHRGLLPEGQLIGEGLGEGLRAWANSDAPPPPPPPGDARAVRAAAWADETIAAVQAAADHAALHEILRGADHVRRMDLARQSWPDQAQRIDAAVAARTQALGPPPA